MSDKKISDSPLPASTDTKTTNGIGIARAKAWREEIDATHIIILAIGRDGTQHVATHGETVQQAREAAISGNRLKELLGWPEDLCHTKPLERKCGNCHFYEPDLSFACNGDGSRGRCSDLEDDVVSSETCDGFEPKDSPAPGVETHGP